MGFVIVPVAADYMQEYAQKSMFGGDYDAIHDITKKQCSDECLNNIKCKAAVWGSYASGTICWLKSSVPQLKDMSSNPDPHHAFIKMPSSQVENFLPSTLDISSIPSGASVYVDNLYKGETPQPLVLTPGLHNVSFFLTGYEIHNESVNVIYGKNTTCKVQLSQEAPSTGILSLDSEPAGAAISLDGTFKGVTPQTIRDIAPGNHQLTFSLPGYETFTEQIMVGKGDTVKRTPTLVKTIKTTISTVATTPPPNRAPTASFTADKYSGNASLLVAFDASASSDTDGTIAQYSWDFGDGKTGSGIMPSHVYEAVGTYRAALTVTDDKGSPTTAFRSISVSGGKETPDTGTRNIVTEGVPFWLLAPGALILLLIAGIVVFLLTRSNLKMVIKQRSVQADGASTIPVRVQFVNGFGQPQKQGADRDVEIKTTSGMIQNVVVPEGKAYADTSLRASREVGPVTLTARSVAKEVQGRVDFVFVPGRLEVTSNPFEILADGRSRATVTVRIQDASGNGVIFLEDKLVQLTTNLGTIVSPVNIPARSPEGSTIITAGETSGTATISAYLDQINGAGTIRFIPPGKRYCMHCGTIKRIDAQYCPECGKLPPSDVDTKTCAGCVAVIPQVARYCDKCGAKQP